jgi:hypothetical protein
MQKALTLMILQLPHVLTDRTGGTGVAIIRAIVSGKGDPIAVAQRRNPAGTWSEDQRAKALTGTWCQEHVVVLQQALALFDSYTALGTACDVKIARQCAVMKPRCSPAPAEPVVLVAVKPRWKSKHTPPITARAALKQGVGGDLTAVTGRRASVVRTSMSEIGTAMPTWPTVKHCGAWLGLAPRTAIAGGKVRRSRVLTPVHRATQAFR